MNSQQEGGDTGVMILDLMVVAFIVTMTAYIILSIVRETILDLRYREWLDMFFDDAPNWWRE